MFRSPRAFIPFWFANVSLAYLTWGCFSAVAWATTNLSEQAADAATLSYAPAPVRLIRDINVDIAGPGTPLENGDILETGDSGAQVEGLGTTLLAIGPRTRVAIGLVRGKAEVALLTGWLKVQRKESEPVATVVIATPHLRVAPAVGAVMIQVAPDGESLFSASGVHPVSELDARRQSVRQVNLSNEAFLELKGTANLKTAARPSREFIASMPVSFRDPLVAVAGKLKIKAVPKLDHSVTFGDIDAWLATDVGTQKIFVSRFKVRLKDTLFREQLDAALGQSPQWKPLLHPAPSPPAIRKAVPGPREPQPDAPPSNSLY